MIAVSIFSALLVHHWCSPLLWSNCGQLPSSEAALRLRQQSQDHEVARALWSARLHGNGWRYRELSVR
jgi:hypothetical protein